MRVWFGWFSSWEKPEAKPNADGAETERSRSEVAVQAKDNRERATTATLDAVCLNALHYFRICPDFQLRTVRWCK